MNDIPQGHDTDEAIGQLLVTELLNLLKGYSVLDHPPTEVPEPSSTFSCSVVGGPGVRTYSPFVDQGEIHRVMPSRSMRARSYSAQSLTRYLVLFFGCTREFIPAPIGWARPGPENTPVGRVEGKEPRTNATITLAPGLGTVTIERMRSLVIVCILTLCACQTPKPENQFDPYGVPPSPSMAEELAARAVRSIVRDHHSFQYRNAEEPEPAYLFDDEDDARQSRYGGYRVDLEVNGRSLFEGYMGFTRAQVFIRNGRFYYIRVWSPYPGSGSEKWRLTDEWRQAYDEEMSGITRHDSVADEVLERLKVKTLDD